jgi:DNA-binding LytR/AlgR family response regulator
MKLKCLIVDDEPAAHLVLENYIGKLDQLELVGNAYNAIEGSKFIMSHEIDVVFLDINMPEISGLEFIQTMKNQPSIILTTAYSEYALNAFDLGVIDYLVKPIPLARFLKAINKLTSNGIQSNEPSEKHAVSKYSIQFRVDGAMQEFKYADILFFQGLGNYIKIITAEKSYLTILTMTDLELQLDESNFMRIHKSYIINTRHLDKTIPKEFVFIGKNTIPIGRSYKISIQNWFKKQLSSK